MKDTVKQFVNVQPGRQTQDGDGVQLTRVIGHPGLTMVDPFLLLDAFESNDPVDYIGGFPPHPHRGFQTISYLLAGRMRHKDSAGHEQVIGPGGVQYMNAGRGVVHSEMPEQQDGRLAGFQLWLNLPKSGKMQAPSYRQYQAQQIPLERRFGGVEMRVIAGSTTRGTRGAIQDDQTQARYFDVSLPPGVEFDEALPRGFNGFVHVSRGALTSLSGAEVSAGEVSQLTPGVDLRLRAGGQGAGFLLAMAWPLNEPVARGGPFVMNTQEEIRQAYSDYQAGRFQGTSNISE